MADLNQSPKPEGTIDVFLRQKARGYDVTIKSDRPVLASKIFEGKPLDKTLALIPMLFGVCGQAQSVAAIRAAENALGQPAGASVETRRNLLILIEGIREHLWRILIDWPDMLGRESKARQFAPLNAYLSQLLEQLNPKKTLTTQPGLSDKTSLLPRAVLEHWTISRDAILATLYPNQTNPYSQPPILNEVDGFPNKMLRIAKDLGWNRLGDHALPALPVLQDDKLRTQLSDKQQARFIAQPVWDGHNHETGPYARQAKHPIVQTTQQSHGVGAITRMVARTVELMQWIHEVDCKLRSRLCDEEAAVAAEQNNLGLCQLEAVRGRLVHCMSINKQQIDYFRILAPTEWNFHPNGIVREMLSRLEPAEPFIAGKQAAFLIKLIDPCVGYKLTWQTGATGGLAHA